MTRKQFFAALLVATLGAVATIAAALAQNSSPQAPPASIVQSYDAANEIVVKGTVEKVADARAPENISGAHLLVTTEQGMIDAHLGPSPSWKAQNLTLAPGEAVELTGVMTNFEGKSVLLARTLKTDNRIAILRNEHGIPTRVSGARIVNAAPLGAKGGRP